MFEPGSAPRVFGLPLGADVPAEIVNGLIARQTGGADALARVELMVNPRRMARRIRAIFDEGPPRLLPRAPRRLDSCEDERGLLGRREVSDELLSPPPVARQ